MSVFTLIDHERHKVYKSNILLRFSGETSNWVSNTVRTVKFPYPVCFCISGIYLTWQCFVSYCTWIESCFLNVLETLRK
jgi:hypothetical protein